MLYFPYAIGLYLTNSFGTYTAVNRSFFFGKKSDELIIEKMHIF